MVAVGYLDDPPAGELAQVKADGVAFGVALINGEVFKQGMVFGNVDYPPSAGDGHQPVLGYY